MGWAFLKSLDEAESQFEDLLGFFKMESLQAGASFEGVAKERGGERKGEHPLFLHPLRFYCPLVHFVAACFVCRSR